MGRTPVWLSVLVFALALVACGGRSERNDFEAATPDQAEIGASCGDLARAMCRLRSDCETPTSRHARYATEVDCRARTKLACSEWATLSGTNLTSASLATCTDTVSAASCADAGRLFYSELSDLPVCLPAGARADGEPCASDAQCQSRTCNRDVGCGTCATPGEWLLDYRYEGEPCDEETSYCQSYLTCETGVCRVTPCAAPGCHDLGYSCTGITEQTAHDCGLGAECTGKSDLGSGKCLPYAADGEACGAYDGPPCQYPASCVDERCRLPHELGCR